MSVSSVRLAVTAVSVGVTAVCYGLTFQQRGSFGPIPILLWLSIPVVVVGGLALGGELGHKFSPTRRTTTALAQLVGIALVQTSGMVVGWSLAPAFFDHGVVRTYYGVPLLLGVPLVALYHLVGWLRVRSGR